MTENTRRSPLRLSPITIGRQEAKIVATLALQWTIIYVYFLIFPTTFAKGTEHHAILNTTIVGGYQLFAYAALLLFRGKVSNRVFYCLPGLSLLAYELNVFSYCVYLIEYLRYGEVSFKYAQDRLIDKQNIITGFLAMLVMTGGILCFVHKASVARKVGLALGSVMMMALIVYHVNLYFFQFKPMVDTYEEYQQKELRQLSFSQNLVVDCAKHEDLECYRFNDGDPWPEGAVIQGSKSLADIEEDYANGWKALIKEKAEKSPDPRMIWTEAFRDSSFDETFAPQYSALVVFTKYYDQNTVLIYREMISYIFQMSERMSLCILVVFLFWMSVGYVIANKHPSREEDIPVGKYLVLWVATGLVAFFFEFQIYLHVMLIGLAAVLMYRRRWSLLVIGLLIYMMTYSHVGISIVLMEGFVDDALLVMMASVSALAMVFSMIWLLWPAKPDWKVFVPLILMIGFALVFVSMNTDMAEAMVPAVPVSFFMVSLVCLVKSRSNLMYLFPGMFMVMAGIMSFVMTLWFVPGMYEDAVVEDRLQDLDDQINLPLATAYFIYAYFALVMGIVFHYLIKSHKGLFETINRKNAKQVDKNV